MAKSILLVDDNPMIRRLIRCCVESLPDVQICEEAVDGSDGLEKAERLKPDLVILDFSMPGMDGLELARILKQRMPYLPVILFTMFNDAVTESELRAAGVTAVVGKSEVPKLIRFSKAFLQGNVEAA